MSCGGCIRTREVLEDVDDVVAQRGVARQQAQVGVHRRRAGIVVPRTDVDVGAEPMRCVPLPPHHLFRNIGVILCTALRLTGSRDELTCPAEGALSTLLLTDAADHADF